MVEEIEKKEETKEIEECITMCCPEEGTEILKGDGKKIIVKMEGRGNVVMTRLHDDDLKKIDSLVELDVFKSRSEAVAFFIKEGIQARGDLFQKVMPTVDKIRDLKEEAKKSLNIET